MVTFTFSHPQYLWFLFAIPILFVTHFFLLRHTRRKALKFANFVALKRVTGERMITKNYTILAIRILIIVFAVLAVSGLNVWYESKTNQNDYVVTIDTSASMTTQDVQPTRLDAAKAYAAQFADALAPSTKLGLVSFSGVTFIETTLSTNRNDFKDALNKLEAVAAGTDIAGAIITSTNLLVNVDRGRAIILITDGSNTIEDFTTSNPLVRAVSYAQTHRVKIYTIGVGKDVTTPIGYLPQYYNVSATYNADNLIYLANATGGEYYFAQDKDQLAAAYNDIKSSEKSATLNTDLTSPLMLAALLFLMVEWGLINTRFRSIP